MNNEVKLSVHNLRISFRTDAGKVQAVRDISFDLHKGETLAIVGESGSGKSVTSKAIMGISAVNAMVEGGEILYDGQDLTRIPEEEMHKLRGDKIAMIFQDPLSSLNPIMRIGRQITEAMLLKNKANRRAGRIEFNAKLHILSKMMQEALTKKQALGDKDAGERLGKVSGYIKIFDGFNVKAITLENGYNHAKNTAEELISIISDFLFLAEKKQRSDTVSTLKIIRHKLKNIRDPYFVGTYANMLNSYMVGVNDEILREKSRRTLSDIWKRWTGRSAVNTVVSPSVVKLCNALKDTLTEMLSKPSYNFFRIGYYVYKHPRADLSQMPAEEANAKAYRFLMEDYMTEFLAVEKEAVAYAESRALQGKKRAVESLQRGIAFFEKGGFTMHEAEKTVQSMTQAVLGGINLLDVAKDNVAYTFGGALDRETEKYFFYVKNNPKEEKRFARQTAKRNALLAKGKRADWQVAPKVVVKPEEQLANIIAVMRRVLVKFYKDIENAGQTDMDRACEGLIDYLKEKASQVVFKLTKRGAKERAIKLMDEVGIPEARMRYRQYPFEFSGGMRQRIVIAIALSANPDILICDEPTTALDVTIQSQILELINRLKAERNLSIIFITHDLGVVANMADRIAVMYAGKIVEYGTADDLFYDPRHPYTWALLSSMPDLDTNEALDTIPGTPPNMIYPPMGDAFAARNKYAMEIDFQLQPPMFEVSPTHYAATWLLHPYAEKVELPPMIAKRIQRMKQRGEIDGE